MQRLRRLRPILLLCALLLVAGKAELWWFRHLIESTGALGGVAGQRQALVYVSCLLLQFTLFGLAGGTWAIIEALRQLRAGRWPLPGTIVDRPTRVIRGLCLGFRSSTQLVVMGLLTLYIGYSAVRTLDTLWTIQLDSRNIAAWSRVTAHTPGSGAGLPTDPDRPDARHKRP